MPERHQSWELSPTGHRGPAALPQRDPAGQWCTGENTPPTPSLDFYPWRSRAHTVLFISSQIAVGDLALAQPPCFPGASVSRKSVRVDEDGVGGGSLGCCPVMSQLEVLWGC